MIKDEVFDFLACIQEATGPFKKDAQRKGITYEVIEHPGLPRYVYGDQRRVRQAVANMTANAVEHTTAGGVKIECYTVSLEGSKVRVEIVVEDTGNGMSKQTSGPRGSRPSAMTYPTDIEPGNAKLDALFRDLEQVSTDADDGLADDELGESKDSLRTLGLGLAVVARIVRCVIPVFCCRCMALLTGLCRNVDGQLRLKSEDGKGSRFVIQLPFEMPPTASPELAESVGMTDPSISGSRAASVTTTLPPAREGEVTLVERGGPHNPHKQTLSHSISFDNSVSEGSLRSATSKGSGKSTRSDADRLIDAIQTPLGIGEPESESASSQRRNSKSAYYRSSQKSVARSVSPNRPSSGRPQGPSRSLSFPDSVNDMAVAVPDTAPVVGMEFITDSKTPIRPVKVSDEYKDQPERPAQPSETSGVVFEVGDTPAPSKSLQTGQSRPASNATTADGNVQLADKPKSARLQVLVAEDDPINMKILRKRLEKAGHTVHHTVNGEDCAQAYKGSDGKYDVVLMDMQVRLYCEDPRVFLIVRCADSFANRCLLSMDFEVRR